MGVSGWMFLLVPAYPGCPGSKAVKRLLLLLLLLLCTFLQNFVELDECVVIFTTWCNCDHLTLSPYVSMVYAVVGCSARLLQAGIISKRHDESSWFLAWWLPCTDTTLCCKETWLPPKVRILSSGTHSHLTVLCPGLPGWAGTRKVKPIWILLKQEAVSGSGISWAICKQSAPRSRQITTPAPHHSVFTGQMPFLPPNQQHETLCQTLSTQKILPRQVDHDVNKTRLWSLLTTPTTFMRRGCWLHVGQLCPSIIPSLWFVLVLLHNMFL